MSGLRSALDEWTTQDLAEAHVDQLAEDLVELESAASAIEVERARRLTRYAERAGPATHGYPSLTAFLIDRCRTAGGRARRLVALAHTVSRCPRVREAWVDQRISIDQAHRLLEASDSAPGPFAGVEGKLVEIVEPLTAGDTRHVLQYWRQSVVGPMENPDEQENLRGLDLSQTIGGMGRIDGWLTPSAFQAMRATIGALLPPPAPNDHRTARQRRHDALEDLARDFLDHADTPTVGGEKPHLNLVCDLDALKGIAGGHHEFQGGEVISIATLRRMSCDSSVCRIVFGPSSEVIDVGRRTRTIPTGLRRAVIARDRHCTYRGCDRPARWCDVHHRTHWADGGTTQLDNCVLLCRFHHTLVHRKEAAQRAQPERGENGHEDAPAFERRGFPRSGAGSNRPPP
ncbi:MAG: DUF222 domain-containing protein [Acidimicrobiia bacterium]